MHCSEVLQCGVDEGAAGPGNAFAPQRARAQGSAGEAPGLARAPEGHGLEDSEQDGGCRRSQYSGRNLEALQNERLIRDDASLFVVEMLGGRVTFNFIDGDAMWGPLQVTSYAGGQSGSKQHCGSMRWKYAVVHCAGIHDECGEDLVYHTT